jgi:hypothetical protein
MKSVLLVILSYLVQIPVYFYFIHTFTKNICEPKNKFKGCLNVLFVSLFTLIIASMAKPLFPLNLIIIIISLFFSFVYIFKLKKTMSIVLAFTLPIMMLICEFLTVCIFMNVLKASAENIINNPIISIIALLLHSLLLILSIFIINKLMIKRIEFKNFLQRLEFKYTKVFIFLTLVTIIPTLILIIIKKYEFSPLFIFVNALQLSIISIFIFVYMKKTIEHEITEKEKDIIKMDNKTLTDMVDRS